MTADSERTEEDARIGLELQLKGKQSHVIQSNRFVVFMPKTHMRVEGTHPRLEFILNSAQRTRRAIMPPPPSSLPPVCIFPACRWCTWCGNKQTWCIRVSVWENDTKLLLLSAVQTALWFWPREAEKGCLVFHKADLLCRSQTKWRQVLRFFQQSWENVFELCAITPVDHSGGKNKHIASSNETGHFKGAWRLFRPSVWGAGLQQYDDNKNVSFLSHPLFPLECHLTLDVDICNVMIKFLIKVN